MLGRWRWGLPGLMGVLVLWAFWWSFSPGVLLVLVMPLAVYLELRGLDPCGYSLVWHRQQWQLWTTGEGEDGRSLRPGSRQWSRTGSLYCRGRLESALWLEFLPSPPGATERCRHLLVFRDALTAREWSLLRRRLTLQPPS